MTTRAENPTPLYLSDSLTRELLLFDGLSRAGKGLVAPLVSNLARTDYAQINNAVDHVATLWQLKLLDLHSAAAFLRKVIDTKTYEQMIGRNLNTRISDISSVYHSLDNRRLIGRATGPEGQEAVDLYDQQRRMSSFITHFNMPMAELWFTAFPELKAVITVRHPIDVIASWGGRQWGSRWGKDPLGLSPVAEMHGEPVPWFAVGFAEDFLAADPTTRDTRCVLELMALYDITLDGLQTAQRQRIALVCFEQFAVDPMKDLERLAAWLETSVPTTMPIALARERVPRALPLIKRQDKLQALKGQLDDTLYARLIEVSRSYEDVWGLERAA